MISNFERFANLMGNPSFKNLFRKVELKKIDWSMIIEGYLAQIGIVNSKDISKKLYNIIKQTDELLLNRSLETTNMRILINLINGCYKFLLTI